MISHKYYAELNTCLQINSGTKSTFIKHGVGVVYRWRNFRKCNDSGKVIQYVTRLFNPSSMPHGATTNTGAAAIAHIKGAQDALDTERHKLSSC